MSLAKKILVVLVIVFSANSVFAQTFMHGVGVNVFVSKLQSLEARAFGGFDYSPRVTFMETEAISLTVGIPLSVGITGSYNYSSSSYYGTYEENSLGFMLNAPVMINFNAGCGSTKENESRFGFFAGGGFGYHYQSAGGTQYDESGYVVKASSSTSDYGPAANMGFRIAVGSHQKNIETRFSYMKGISDSKANVFGVGVLFNF